MGSTLYSIGHGNKKIEDFIAELESFKIQYLLDIRSKPYSKWSFKKMGEKVLLFMWFLNGSL